MASQKKFYEGVEGEKRIAATFSPKQYKMLRLLQVHNELAEKEVIVASVEEMYTRCIEESAVDAGLFQSSELTLARGDFNNDELFNKICAELNVLGPDGKVDSVKQVALVISKAYIPEE